MANNSADSGQVGRRKDGILGSAQMGGTPREEPFRTWAGWNCPRCDSTNTIIEGYDRTLEGYCMSCARYLNIPEENLNVYYEANPPSARRKSVLQVQSPVPVQAEDTWGREGEGQGHDRGCSG